MNHNYVVNVFETEAKNLDLNLRNHSKLSAFFTKISFNENLKKYYGSYLNMTTKYVSYTVPMLRAAGEALALGDDEDKIWSQGFLHYANDEIDEIGNYGHHVWAEQDLQAIGENLVNDIPKSIKIYGDYFVKYAAKHPYAILGAKGVLENLSILSADDFVEGILASSLPNKENAVSFLSHHGTLDIEHVKQANENLSKISSEEKLMQIVEGVYFTSGSYREFLKLI